MYWLKRIVRKLLSLLRGSGEGAGGPRTHHDAQSWQKHAQEGEFRFHKKNKWRRTDDFLNHSIRLFDHFGFQRDQYAGRTVIDLGAGSKLRTRYFEGAELIVIEPLADRFLKEIDWCDLTDAAEVYSLPAEERIPECVERADLVVSINVLDHCYDFEDIVENIHAYLKDDGTAFLSFDKHEEADEMHPLQLDEEICAEIFTRKDFRIERFTTGTGGVQEGDTYGHGPYCLNYRLKKVDV